MMRARDEISLTTLVDDVLQAREELLDLSVEARAAWLAFAFDTLRDPDSRLGSMLRQELLRSTGLSAPMINWALEHALLPLTDRALGAFVRELPRPTARAIVAQPGRLCVVVLAGNVFTAAARAIAWPLMLGWPVIAKASSADSVFPRLLEAALAENDPDCGRAFRVVNVPSDDIASLAVLLERAEALSVYGSDDTLRTLRNKLAPHVSFQGHGHGLGAAFVAAHALSSDAAAREAARALALDVAAYDQRGCLSPHAAFVVRDQAVSVQRFGELLRDELGALEAQLPRGPLPFEVASAQLSYRGLSAMHGTLLEGPSFAVAVDAEGPLRVSPGYRNIQVLGVADTADLLGQLAPLGVHLKCLGVAGLPAEGAREGTAAEHNAAPAPDAQAPQPALEARDSASGQGSDEPHTLAALAAQLPARLAPRICALGTMQAPPANTLQDGVPPWEGLVRFTELP